MSSPVAPGAAARLLFRSPLVAASRAKHHSNARIASPGVHRAALALHTCDEVVISATEGCCSKRRHRMLHATAQNPTQRLLQESLVR